MSVPPESRYVVLARRVVEAYAAQLLRDLQIINERAVRELGPLPHGGLPVRVKSKPKPAPWVQPVPALDDNAHTAPRVPMPERKDPAMSKPMPPAIENGLPAPPVPQKLRELLKDYPELIQRLQEVLDDYSRKPNRLMPFDGAIWALEGRLDSFFSEAREELEAAYAKGDPEGIEKAKKKRFAVGYSRLNKGPMSELASYFEGARDQVIRNARP
ncbi:hypothetical protein [Xanthomonas phaseoli]|uniref:Uncharacterized protein n=1 Tax=Xanthomonas manihotis TaxID=43353 RepID=A0A8I1XLY3_XANMN|nr:hypothetical protein [Xanthomonas phaseoli]RWU16053.1 hypothetical protein XANMN_13790 [Xanthomonas phaseoli pv. manihotis str. CIO151]MBO9757306.1 hypothetical protein [Xanthomonas phaseoli pv. manihotis]MBO9760428.1 hypothetical protein [Xanthomonas phaseoli pv. manihotis]MBO9766072.1 hypothetical protein [Xanthomonas phaseoli pv. manihotis]MBO9784662.1 hypothetical protein [Xanthomonas phaseoli pv. manihotis]